MSVFTYVYISACYVICPWGLGWARTMTLAAGFHGLGCQKFRTRQRCVSVNGILGSVARMAVGEVIAPSPTNQDPRP